MATALITGASNGIGLELARIFARQGTDLVLVARSSDKLTALKEEIIQQYPQTSVILLSRDLSLPDAALEVYETLQKDAIIIDYLVNNAGFGEFGFFIHTPWEKEAQMIDLNVKCLTQLTKLFVQDMVRRRSGKIMNVASTAAFQPGPLMSVYFATKAYVLHFSEAVNNEVKGSGVHITALCPGPTASGFVDAASMNESGLIKGRKLPSSKQVAEYGYKAMMKGKAVAIHGKLNYIMANAARFTPRNWVVEIARRLQGSNHKK